MIKFTSATPRTKILCAAALMTALGLATGTANAREAVIPPMFSGQSSFGPDTDPLQYQPYFQNYSDYKSWATNAQISRMQIWTMDQGLQWRVIVTPNTND
jgi:hypothetical protein